MILYSGKIFKDDKTILYSTFHYLLEYTKTSVLILYTIIFQTISLCSKLAQRAQKMCSLNALVGLVGTWSRATYHAQSMHAH